VRFTVRMPWPNTCGHHRRDTAAHRAGSPRWLTALATRAPRGARAGRLPDGVV